MHDRYRVSVEALENGFSVEVPDMEAIAQKEAEAKKKSKDGCCPVGMYYGDCIKKYAARNVKEVIKLVSQALERMPEAEFDAAFDEAAAKK